MTFDVDLQGQSSHEALLQRQDTELKLLDNIHKCLNLRIKAERNYSDALSAIVTTGNKFDPKCESSIFKVNF